MNDNLRPEEDGSFASQEELKLDERWARTMSAVEKLREKLLDLSASNRLLNFKFSDRSQTHLRIIDELPDILYRKLVDGTPLTFKALPEPDFEPKDEHTEDFLIELEAAKVSDADYIEAMEGLDEEDETSAKGQKIERALKDRLRRQLGMPERPTKEIMTPAQYARERGYNPSYELPMPEESTPDHSDHHDNELQTLYFPDQLERKLTSIRAGANRSLTEAGVNTLYVAFGFLEWYEDDDSDKKMLAPLLLHPVKMEHKSAGNRIRYSISTTGDDTATNVTLALRLRESSISLEIPKLEKSETPEKYFERVAEIVSDKRRWKIRRFVAPGLFSFSRLAMYEDLNPERWKNNPLEKNAILVDLLGRGVTGELGTAPDYHVDSPDIAAKAPLLILDADASQFSAIVDAMDGKNLIIKGPPGTGKSQTITNMIAALLAAGKKVLFLAEKMAALDQVKKRIDAAGLGHFCLEIHSAKAEKKKVLDSLKERLDFGRFGDLRGKAYCP